MRRDILRTHQQHTLASESPWSLRLRGRRSPARATTAKAEVEGAAPGSLCRAAPSLSGSIPPSHTTRDRRDSVEGLTMAEYETRAISCDKRSSLRGTPTLSSRPTSPGLRSVKESCGMSLACPAPAGVAAGGGGPFAPLCFASCRAPGGCNAAPPRVIRGVNRQSIVTDYAKRDTPSHHTKPHETNGDTCL